MELEDFLQDLKRTIEKWKREYENDKTTSSERLKTYEVVIESKKFSEAETVKALLGRVFEYSNLEKESSELIILYSLNILANHVAMLKIVVDGINEQLKESGVIEKAKDIEDIKELKRKLNETARLLKDLFEQKKKMEETSKKDFLYIV